MLHGTLATVFLLGLSLTLLRGVFIPPHPKNPGKGPGGAGGLGGAGWAMALIIAALWIPLILAAQMSSATSKADRQRRAQEIREQHSRQFAHDVEEQIKRATPAPFASAPQPPSNRPQTQPNPASQPSASRELPDGPER